MPLVLCEPGMSLRDMLGPQGERFGAPSVGNEPELLQQRIEALAGRPVHLRHYQSTRKKLRMLVASLADVSQEIAYDRTVDFLPICHVDGTRLLQVWQIERYASN